MSRSRTWRAAAIVVATAIAVAGCTVPDDEGRTENKAPSTSPPGFQDEGPPPDAPDGPDEPTTSEPAPTPKTDDVPDRAYPGLGDPRIDVSSYDVTVRADPGKDAIQGRATIELAPTGGRPLDSFTLDLRGPRMIQVTVDGSPAQAEAGSGGAEWTITPDAPLLPGTQTTVIIDYGGTPDPTPFALFENAQVGWQADEDGGWFTMSEPRGTSEWAPVSDHPSDKARWKVTLDTPKGSTGVSNGHLVSHKTSRGRTRWVWEEDQPIAPYLVLAAVGKYDLVDRKGTDGLRLTYAFPPDLPTRDRKAFDQLDDIVSVLTDLLGPLPATDLGAIVVNQDLGLALEVQSRPLFGTDSMGQGRVDALAHELAHQWFGDDVTLARWPDLWLNEGFATYADWLYRERKGADIDALAKEVAGQYADVGLTVRDVEAARTFDLVVYNRGALTLHALRRTVGDDTFFEILHTWSRRHSGGNGTTEQFVALASSISGDDLTDFFHAWLDAVPQPPLPE